MSAVEFDFTETAPAPKGGQNYLIQEVCSKRGNDLYTPPATRSASKRWKRIHEQSMMLRLDEMHVIKKQNAQMSKEAARKIIRKIPVEVLAKEWLSKEDATVDMRAYLVDHVLPTLILGVERLLKEVDEKQLASRESFEPDFNPLNFLAQYLMRNNPRFSNFAEASPYVRGLREVSEELKQELFTFEDNRLARIKAEARRKRSEREKLEQLQKEEKDRRQRQLVTQFKEWNVPTDNNRVELSLLQNALMSFAEIAEQLPDELQEVAKFGHPLEPVDETGRTLAVKEFAQYISLFVEDLPIEVFEQFMVHMSKCAAAHRAAAERENRRIILSNLFIYCDHGGIGLLDRHRILTLFEHYWDMARDRQVDTGTLRNPRKWPVVEVEEVDDMLFDKWDEDEGGVLMSEERRAQEQADAIASDLDLQTKVAAVHDQENHEMWKQRLLTQRAEELSKRIRAHGPQDFLHAGFYPYVETLEVQDFSYPIPHNKAFGPHSMYEIDIAETEERRNVLSNKHLVQKKVVDKKSDKDENENASMSELLKMDEGETLDTEGAAPEAKEEEKAPGVAEESVAEQKEGGGAETTTVASTEEGGKEDGEKTEEKEEEKVEQEAVKEEGEKGTEKVEEEKKEEEATTEEEEGEGKTEGTGTEEEAGPSGDDKKQEEITETKEGEDAPAAADAKPEGEGKESGDTKEGGDGVAESQAETTEEFDVEITSELAKTKGGAQKPHDPTTVTGRQSVTFAGNTDFNREKTGLTTSQSRSQSRMSAFDETILNVSQFVQLTETYLGHHPAEAIFTMLVSLIKEGYQETEEEKMERLVKARKEAISAKRKLMLDNLFDKWDNDGSGFLEMEDVQEVMFKYKDGQEMDAIKRAQSGLRKRSKYHDQRLSRREFRQFVDLVVEQLPGAESFEFFVEFMTNSVERSYAERIRGEARKKWLTQIVTSSLVSGIDLDPVYKAVFHSLYKDAEAHGAEKKISASISMLEKNNTDPERGDLCLRYAACTQEDCQYLLGQVLYQNQRGISWNGVETGNPVHVPRVANHGNIYFWNYDRLAEDREGSFIVVPLKDNKKRVFGILGIDTMLDTHKKAIFITHEIQFFQGVAKSFSVAYHNIDIRRKLLRITESAISWIQRRCPHIADISVYIVEPSMRSDGDPVLRKMMTTDKKGAAVQVTDPIRMERKDNLFRDYLFKCMDNSETVTADAYGQRHTASPLRNDEGKAIGVVDISIGSLKRLPAYENKEAQRMLRLLQQAHREITKEADGADTQRVLEAEQDDDSRMDIMFDRLMLMELRENVSRLDPQAFAELKSYNEPPQVIHDILRATMAIFEVHKAIEGIFEDWNVLKNHITAELIQQIKTYDPTVMAQLVNTEIVEQYLKAVPHGAVAKHGSIPAQQLYNWVFVCISLIEHTRKMRENAAGNVMVSAAGKEGSINQDAH